MATTASRTCASCASSPKRRLHRAPNSLNEFYTRSDVAQAMWAVVQRLGVQSGTVLKPSCGAGVYLRTAPAGFKVTGVELDGVSAQIAQALHSANHEAHNASLERFATQDDRQFDAIIGNVPFGLRGALIKDDKPHWKTAEAYFCDTAMDKARGGGVVELIVPTGVMDGKNHRKLREMLMRKGQFLGAQRMPNTAFEHAHTEVTTDIVWGARPALAGMCFWPRPEAICAPARRGTCA